jgi:hypothetical protein
MLYNVIQRLCLFVDVFWFWSLSCDCHAIAFSPGPARNSPSQRSPECQHWHCDVLWRTVTFNSVQTPASVWLLAFLKSRISIYAIHLRSTLRDGMCWIQHQRNIYISSSHFTTFGKREGACTVSCTVQANKRFFSGLHEIHQGNWQDQHG